MISRVIDFSTKNRFFTIFLTMVLAYAGWKSFQHIPIDAIPDLSDPQVIVYSQWNVSPDIIEDQVTYPIVTGLLGAPKVKDIRGVSTFGNSFVYVLFEEDTDIYWARSRILEYLSKITPQLPKEARTELGPDATGVGWVYQYALRDTSGNNSLADLRAFQDWFLRYQLQSVEGVAEVASIGGFEKQFQVKVNPNALRSFNISLRKVIRAIREGNSEVGARVIEFAGTEYMVRARGYVKSRTDIENIVVASNDQGVPIYIKNIANVALGPQMRRGATDLNGEGDTVGGIVVMRFGENANAVIQRVKQKLEELKTSFPQGVELVETYDRSHLIKRAIDTLTHELTLELLVVALIILIFLLHIPSSFVPIIALPTAVLVSFIPMYLLGISANIMSLGGIAIAIGAMVDAALVVVENCHKKLERQTGMITVKESVRLVVEAVKEVGPSSFFSLLVIAIAFLPIFALEEQAGRLFRPLAYTKTFAMLVAAFFSVTFVPALLAFVHSRRSFSFQFKPLNSILNFFLVGKHRTEEDHPISRFLFRTYGPTVDWAVKHRVKVVVAALILLGMTIPLFLKLGSEFMPPLNEGTILYMPTTMPGISITEAQSLLQRQDKILRQFPEVKSIFGKVGRAETATDPAPLSMVETTIVLKDPQFWRKKERWYSFLPKPLHFLFGWIIPTRLTWEELIAEMNSKMQFPGSTNAWTMPIKGRIDMLSTGIRTPVGIKIYGSNLKTIERMGLSLEGILKKVPKTRSVYAERVAGGYFLDIDFNREALARYGVSLAEAQQVIEHAVGGKTVSVAVSERERYSINVRYARDYRSNLDNLKQILISTPSGQNIPLGAVASLHRLSGPGMIRTENGLLAGYVFIDISDSDIGGYVKRAKASVSKELTLTTGYSLEWSGQYQSMLRVSKKLWVVIPLTLFIIALLIFANTRSGIETAIIFLAVPFSAIGAVWLLYLLDYNMSIAVWVGLIALLGIDAETAIFMLLYLKLAYKKRKEAGTLSNLTDLKEAIHEGAVKRIRPKMMTVTTTFAALLPILLASSSQAGADVMKRMAAPMVGGILSSFLLELLVYPALFAIWKTYELEKEKKVTQIVDQKL